MEVKLPKSLVKAMGPRDSEVALWHVDFPFVFSKASDSPIIDFGV